MAMNPGTWPGDGKGFVIYMKPEFPKRWRCRAHWTEAGCRYSAVRVV